MKEHKFIFNLPMHPHQRHLDRDPKLTMKMDGRNLNGVTGLCVKAGTNGYTNVAIEFNAPAAIELAGALLASVDTEDELLAMRISTCYREAVMAVEGFDPDEVDGYQYQSHLVKRLLEHLIDEFSG